MLQLPNEIIFCIGELLCLSDRRSLRCTSRRLYRVLRRIREPKPLELWYYRGYSRVKGPYRRRRFSLTMLELLNKNGVQARETRAILFNLGTGLWNETWNVPFHQFLSEPKQLDYLSVSSTYNYAPKFPLSDEAGNALHTLENNAAYTKVAHLELINVQASHQFLKSLTALVDITLVGSVPFGQQGVENIVNALRNRPMVAFTTSVQSAPVNLVDFIAQSLPTLRTMTLVWADENPVRRWSDLTPIQSIDCSVNIEEYAYALSKCPRLESVYLPLFASSSRNDGRQTRNTLLANWQSRWERRPDLSLEGVLEATEQIVEKCPKLTFLGWLLPQQKVSDGYKPFGCIKGIEKWRWTYETDDWPDSDMDIMFSK